MGTTRLRHGDFVTAVCFLPGGRAVLSASHDGTLRLWDTANGRELRKFVGHQGRVECLALAPGAKLVASGGHDGTVRLWDLTTGREVKRLAGQRGPVYSVAFSPDGKTLAAGSDGILIWDPASGELVREFPRVGGWIVCLAFAADGQALAFASDREPVVHIWDSATGKEVRQLRGHEKPIRGLAYSPDGRLLATAGQDGTLRLWDPATSQERQRLTAGQANGPAAPIAFSDDGRQVACSVGETAIRVWDLPTGKELRRFQGHHGWIFALAFSPDGRTLASGSGDATVRLWRAATGKELLPPAPYDGGIFALALSPDGKRLLSCGDLPGITLWDAGTGKHLRTLAAESGAWLTMALSNHGNILATSRLPDATTGNAIRLWDPVTGAALGRLETPQAQTGAALAFSADGQTLAAAAWAQPVRVWHVATRKQIQTFPEASAVAFAPHGGRLVTADYHSHLVAYDTASGAVVRRFQVDDTAPSHVAVSPDGRFLAASGSRSKVWLWDFATGERLWEWEGNPLYVRALAFSPDGHTLACAGEEPGVRLCEVGSGTERGCLRGHQGPVYALSFTADGRRLASAGKDTTALVWDLPAWADGGRAPSAAATPQALELLWSDLGGDDATKAYRAIWQLSVAPRSVEFLERHLRSAAPPNLARLKELIAGLDSDQFADREQATAALAKEGETAEPALTRALAEQPSAEARQRIEALLNRLKRERAAHPGPAIRPLRAVEVLQHANSVRARQLLRALAGGAPGARLTRAAEAAQAYSARLSAPARP